MFELRSENLTGLGGPMGTEHVWDNWRKYFSTMQAAKAAAEQDYGHSLRWHIMKGGCVRTGDLLHVMYYIKPVKVEK